jgi:alcohol dehydrogenase (cytochrome c)
MVLVQEIQIMMKLSLLCVLFALPAMTAIADDWPQWQGPDRNAVSREKGLLQEWPENGPALAWRVDGLGGGDSAPAVADGKLYGLSNRDGKEIVWALSEADGKEVWVTALGDAVEQGVHQSKEGPGGTRLFCAGGNH